MTPHAFFTAVRRRTTQLLIAAAVADDDKFTRADAEAIAVKEIAAEARRHPNRVEAFVADASDQLPPFADPLYRTVGARRQRISARPEPPSPLGRSTAVSGAHPGVGSKYRRKFV